MKFTDLKELNFLDETLEETFLKSKKIIEDSLGRKLERADPILLLLKTLLAIIFQLKMLLDETAKQNLLYYAKGENLEHFGILVGVNRLAESAAHTAVEVKLSAPRAVPIIISAGTRIHAGDNNYFALASDVIFLAGETIQTCRAVCQTFGEAGNNYEPGELNKIVDPQPFLAEIKNLTKSEGGADTESDDSYRERIRQAPESFSTAGSKGAYIFHTKSVSSLIKDVFILSENPGEVDIYPLLDGGELPGAEMLEAIEKYLSDEKIRPLTDKVVVKTPQKISYDIELRFIISESDSADAVSIIEKVSAAVDEFVIWQKSVLGRDINDTELYYRIRQAGAKRAQIISPTFTPVADNAVAVCENINLVYGGLEKD